jgi:uncharacterized protein (TIGR03435 family)
MAVMSIMRGVCWATRLGLTGLTAAALLGSGIAAQAQDAADAATKPVMMAKDADPDWEVVTVKPSDPNAQGQSFWVDGRHVTIGNRTVETMLLFAYGVQKEQIVGAPEWVRTEHFDANGVPNMNGKPNIKQFQGMVRKLLAERFGLKLHREQREMPVYALTVARGGPKMEKSAGDPDGLASNQDHENAGQRSIQTKNATMGDFAQDLLYYTDRPVVDQTGLSGRYDFTLRYTFDDSRAPTDGSAPPSLFTAIQEQMGLKLDPVRAPADVLVVDSVQKPGAN